MKSLSDDGMKRLSALLDYPDLSETPYRMIGRIASGGMGTIFEVEDKKLCRRVALKVLTLPDNDGQMVLRMEREAQIMAQLEHPAIVPIHDRGLNSNIIVRSIQIVKSFLCASILRS